MSRIASISPFETRTAGYQPNPAVLGSRLGFSGWTGFPKEIQARSRPYWMAMAILFPFAHVSHWLWVLYVPPVLIVAGSIVRNVLAERRRD